MMQIYKEKRNTLDDKLAILEAVATAAMYKVEEMEGANSAVAYALYKSLEDFKESLDEFHQVKACG